MILLEDCPMLLIDLMEMNRAAVALYRGSKTDQPYENT
jgi:hypothetical protein